MTDTQRQSIGPYLRAAREAAGLSQRLLGIEIGTDSSRISSIENGRYDVYPALLDRYIAALNLDRDEVYHIARRIPPEIAERIPDDLSLIRDLRERFGL